MAADGQMDPADLEQIAGAVARGEVDYAKANRLFTGQAWQLMPQALPSATPSFSMLTKIASGYWHVADSQSGYTAISRELLSGSTSTASTAATVSQRHARPPECLERSRSGPSLAPDLRPGRALRDQPQPRRAVDCVAAVEGLLLAAAREVRDPRLPLVFFYMLGILLTLTGLILGVVETVLRLMGNELDDATMILVALLLISGVQLLFAMWFDMESNKDLVAPILVSSARRVRTGVRRGRAGPRRPSRSAPAVDHVEPAVAAVHVVVAQACSDKVAPAARPQVIVPVKPAEHVGAS